MRGSTALFLAGAAAIVSGTVAPAFSADDPARVAPAPAAEAESAAPPPEEATVEAVEDDPGAEEGEGGLERPTLEPAIEERSREEPGREARAKERDSDDAAKQPLANTSVTMKNFKFNPKTLTIAPGDRVTWSNRDMAQHNAVDRNGEFETDLLEKGESESVTIGSAGTYSYVCTVHDGMNGKLVVRSSGGGSASGSGSSGGSSGSSGSTGSSTASSGGSTFPSSSSGSSSSGSSGSLPNTGQEQLPLLILGAGLIVAGLLARAFHEYWIWR